MSNGERYHKDSLTCAHARFALGSLLKVTNIKNGKSVVVEVTDRCAKHARRIIDLPELDFETTKGVPDYSPAWRKKKQTHTKTDTENKK